MAQDLAADLTQDQNAALGDVRSAAQTESHKIVTQDWGIPPREVFDRFEAQRKAVRRKLLWLFLIPSPPELPLARQALPYREARA